MFDNKKQESNYPSKPAAKSAAHLVPPGKPEPKPSIEKLKYEEANSKQKVCEFWQNFGFDVFPRNPEPIEWDGDPATHFDRHPDHDLACKLTTDVISIGALVEEANAQVRALCQQLKSGPPFPLRVIGNSYFMYRLAEVQGMIEDLRLPKGVQLFRPGDFIPLPVGEEFRPETFRAKSVQELPAITLEELKQAAQRVPDPLVEGNPLASYSLLGQAAKYERIAVETRPLLGNVCMAGELTVLYGPPNVGKTLIMLKLLILAIQQKLIEAGNVYYINADDSSAGFALKMRLMDDQGVHTLSPGQAGFQASELAEILTEMVAKRKARGVLIIIDTLKKFVDLMSKKESSVFANACRQFAMAGGTIVAFAHTNKNPAANGKLTYAGTADIIQDFDAAYVLTPLEDVGTGGETVVEFEARKGRGGGTKRVAYAYAADDGISYEERLSSVRLVEPEQLDAFQEIEAQKADAQIIAAVRECIEAGITKKMNLAKAASERAEVSERAAIRAIETYTGSDPSRHHWAYRIKERGAKVYELLPNPPEDQPPEAEA